MVVPLCPLLTECWDRTGPVKVLDCTSTKTRIVVRSHGASRMRVRLSLRIDWPHAVEFWLLTGASTGARALTFAATPPRPPLRDRSVRDVPGMPSIMVQHCPLVSRNSDTADEFHAYWCAGHRTRLLCLCFLIGDAVFQTPSHSYTVLSPIFPLSPLFSPSAFPLCVFILLVDAPPVPHDVFSLVCVFFFLSS